MWWNPQGPKTDQEESGMQKSKLCSRDIKKRDSKALSKAEEKESESNSEQPDYKFQTIKQQD